MHVFMHVGRHEMCVHVFMHVGKHEMVSIYKL